MQQITIEKATSGDIPTIAQIERECFSQPWSEAALRSELAKNDAVLLAAKREGQLIGWGGLQCCLDEGSVTNIAVAPAFRRQKAGALLTAALLQEAAARGLSHVTLEVRKSNVGAIALYEKLGFVWLGIRPRFYSYPTEDAVMMRYTLSAACL